MKSPPQVAEQSRAAGPPGRAAALAAAALVLVALVPVYWRLIADARPDSPHTDHVHHVQVVINLITGQAVWPGRPLYHACVLLLSGWSVGPHIVFAAVAVMTLAAVGRTYLTARMLAAGRPPLAALVALCFALLLAMPLPNWWADLPARLPAEYRFFGKQMPAAWWHVPAIYYGQVSPNAWHSPTASIAMPFNLLLFVAALGSLVRPTIKTAALVGAAMVLSVLGKPNYVMAFAPVFGVVWAVALVREVRAGRVEGGNAGAMLLAAFVPVCLVLAWQSSAVAAEAGDPTKLTIKPFAVWEQESKNIPASVLLGIAFPLVTTALFWREAARDRALLLSWATLAVAVAQFALIAGADEAGPGGWGMEYAGQIGCGIFGWGMTFADQILFVAACAFLLARPGGWRRTLALTVLALHAASGAFLLARCLAIPSLAGVF
jgi:hypothetical protein